LDAFGPDRSRQNLGVDESDRRVRIAAFAFLDERRKLSPDLFDPRELQRDSSSMVNAFRSSLHNRSSRFH
jgi:hypothetical protein